MTDYIRKLVSGNKARFKDEKLNMELDLIYLTDQVIIMGYPAAGIEGWYRNRREDAKKFLEHRHGKNYWVFNFCPIRENSYDPSFFNGRVSRYPFPDHHAPPLAIMPLVAREIHMWLSGSSERVAVLHCKAGKGRSGTMACTYLLTLDDGPTPPKLERSHTAKEWAKIRAEGAMDVVPSDIDDATKQPASSATDTSDKDYAEMMGPEDAPRRTETPISLHTDPVSPVKSFPDSLKGVLDLHTSRRMKAPSSAKKELKQGVSIPSQRRWLYYWALLLVHEAPAYMWDIPPSPTSPVAPSQNQKVRLTQIALRMRETSSAKINLIRAASAVLDRTRGVKNATENGDGHVWVSLARYDDDFVELLEKWEKQTRDENHMGRRKKGSEDMGGEELSELFRDGKWDKGKMVRSFARLGAVGDDARPKVEGEKDQKMFRHILRPLTSKKWDNFRNELQNSVADSGLDLEDANVPASEANSMYDVTQSIQEKGIILNAKREVRIKLYMGQVFMGWMWLIPAFHMSPSEPITRFILTRKEIDFPLGIGSSIVDVEITLEWLKETEAEAVQPPARMTSGEEKAQGMEDEPSGTVAAMQAVDIGSAIEAKQAAKD